MFKQKLIFAILSLFAINMYSTPIQLSHLKNDAGKNVFLIASEKSVHNDLNNKFVNKLKNLLKKNDDLRVIYSCLLDNSETSNQLKLLSEQENSLIKLNKNQFLDSLAIVKNRKLTSRLILNNVRNFLGQAQWAYELLSILPFAAYQNITISNEHHKFINALKDTNFSLNDIINEFKKTADNIEALAQNLKDKKIKTISLIELVSLTEATEVFEKEFEQSLKNLNLNIVDAKNMKFGQLAESLAFNQDDANLSSQITETETKVLATFKTKEDIKKLKLDEAGFKRLSDLFDLQQRKENRNNCYSLLYNFIKQNVLNRSLYFNDINLSLLLEESNYALVIANLSDTERLKTTLLSSGFKLEYKSPLVYEDKQIELKDFVSVKSKYSLTKSLEFLSKVLNNEPVKINEINTDNMEIYKFKPIEISELDRLSKTFTGQDEN